MNRIIFILIVLFPFNLFAKITLKKPECSKVVVIKKTDTLWELAKKYYGCGNRWHNFKKYNIFTNPNLIYPGEKLAIGFTDKDCVISELKRKIKRLKEEKEELTKLLEKTKAEYEILKQQMDAEKRVLQEKLIYIKDLENKIEELETKIQELEKANRELEEKFNSQLYTLKLAEQELSSLYKEKEALKKLSYILGFTIISGIIAFEAINNK